MGQGDPRRQHEGGVIRATSAKYSVTSVLRMRPDDPLWVTSFPPSRHVRFAPRADIWPMPAFMSTPHRAHVAARVVSDAGTTPTTLTLQHMIGLPPGLSFDSRSESSQPASQWRAS